MKKIAIYSAPIWKLGFRKHYNSIFVRKVNILWHWGQNLIPYLRASQRFSIFLQLVDQFLLGAMLFLAHLGNNFSSHFNTNNEKVNENTYAKKTYLWYLLFQSSVYIYICALLYRICFYVALFLSTGKFNVALTALDAILSFVRKLEFNYLNNIRLRLFRTNLPCVSSTLKLAVPVTQSFH